MNKCISCDIIFKSYYLNNLLECKQCRKCNYASKRSLDRKFRSSKIDKEKNKEIRMWLY